MRSAGVLLAGMVVTAGLLVPGATAQRTDRDPPGSEATPKREPLPPPRRERDKSAAKEKAEPKPVPSRIPRPGSGGVPDGGAERARLLDELYARLATAPDEATASRITTAIEHVWRRSISDTVSVLMERSQRAISDRRYVTAMDVLDRAVQLAPDSPEVFRFRAAVHYARDDIYAAIGDLRRALALDPNHYKALEMLGSIFKELGRKKAAHAVYRKLYEVHPQMQGLKSTFEELDREVMGQAS